MNFRARWRGVAAAGLAIAGVVAAAYAFRSLQHRRTVTRLTPRVTEAPRLTDGAPRLSPADTDELLRSTTVTVSDHAARIGLRDASLLAADASAALRLWLQGGADDYRTYLDQRGYDLPESPLWSDPQKAEQLWKQATLGLRSGSFDPVGALLRVKYRDAQPVVSNDLGGETTGWRLDKLPNIQRPYLTEKQLASRSVDLYEVVIPARLRSLGGVEFDGHLGLSYGWDGKRSQWALVQTTIYGTPNGEASSPPPF